MGEYLLILCKIDPNVSKICSDGNIEDTNKTTKLVYKYLVGYTYKCQLKPHTGPKSWQGPLKGWQHDRLLPEQAQKESNGVILNYALYRLINEMQRRINYDYLDLCQ